MRAILSLVLIVSLGASACAGAASSDVGADGSGSFSVVASFYPLAYAAERVGGDSVDVTNLTPPGAEPHDLELTPDDLEAIASADVVVFLGGGFQPSVEEAVDAEATGVVVDALDGVDLLPPAAGVEGDADERLTGDPHVWLDPIIYAQVVDGVASALGQADPDDAGAFADAAVDMRSQLARLDSEFRHGLADCASRVMITNHAAFGYLADAYDLQQQAISGLAPGSEPDPGRVAELASEARELGVTTIFTEDLVSPEVAETLAAEAGIGTAVLSPLEGLTDEQVSAGDDYFSVMGRNLETLRRGLACA